jgi:hypothetical protein
MHKFIIDRSTWRCGSGGSSTHRTGKGFTHLLNSEGFMCCLGQISLQLGCNKNDIIRRCVPFQVNRKDVLYPLLLDNKGISSEFSNSMMLINDNENTTLAEKEELIKTTAKKHQIEVEFVGEYDAGLQSA